MRFTVFSDDSVFHCHCAAVSIAECVDLSVRDLSKIHFSSFLQSVNTEQKGDKLKEKPTQIAEGLFGHKTSLQLLPGKHPQSLLQEHYSSDILLDVNFRLFVALFCHHDE